MRSTPNIFVDWPVMVLAPGLLFVEKLGLVRPLTKLSETCRNAARKKDNASVLIFPELSNTYVAMSIPECQWCKSR